MRLKFRLVAAAGAAVVCFLVLLRLLAGAGPAAVAPAGPAATAAAKDASAAAGRAAARREGHDAASADGQAIDPALFGPGACMAFAPTAGNRHETVFLDAGHGGIDPGAVGSTENGTPVEESTVNLAIELDTMAILRAQGYRVVVSRTRNTSVTRLSPADVSGGILTAAGAFADVAARDVCANMAGADILIGIYMDGGYPGDAGCLTGYDADRPFSAENLRLATLVQNDVLTAMNAQGWAIPDDGVLQDSGLGSALTAAAQAYGHLLLLGPAKAGYFSTPSQMPGALIEPLYVTDPFEASIAVNAQDQQVIAGGIAKAVNQYFGSARRDQCDGTPARRAGLPVTGRRVRQERRRQRRELGRGRNRADCVTEPVPAA
jgi:N-acetylmuramoyl-L-alanine amidase